MSKGKKGKAQPDNVAWDEALVNEPVEDHLWKPYVVFLVGETSSGESHIQALSEAIKDGIKLRKKFVSITREDLLKIAQEDSTTVQSSAGGKKSKQGKAAPDSSSAQKPSLLHPQVCERFVTATNSGEPIPVSLTARMIKYVILKRRVKFTHERDLAAAGNVPETDKKSGSAADKKRSRSPSGRASKANKKIKEPTQLELSSVPVPPKPPTEMKKRGEEDEEAKYINDEPDPGPSCYFVLTGFNSTELFNEVFPIKLAINALVKAIDQKKPSSKKQVTSQDGEDELVKKNLSKFWSNIDQTIKVSPNGSMLRDMARVQLHLKCTVLPQDEVKKAEMSLVLFDELAQEIYSLLRLYAQYQHYLNYLQLYSIPVKDTSTFIEGKLSSTTASSDEAKHEARASDMRYYTNFLSDMPQENVTVPLILHAMLEQVSSSLNDAPSNTTTVQMHPDIGAELANMMNDLVLSKEDKVHLGISNKSERRESVEQIIISHGDDISLRGLNLPSSAANMKTCEEDLLQESGLNSIFMLDDFGGTTNKSDMQALNQFVCSNSKLSLSQFNHVLILLSLDNIELPTASSQPLFKYKECKPSSLLFDHPFKLELVSKEKSMVLASDCPASTDSSATKEDELGASLSSHTLNVSRQQCRLLEYSSLEVFDFHGLLQEMISARDTHPYMEVYEHKHTESLIIVLHTGFNGSPTNYYETSSHIHTKVGFTNFMEYVLEKYGLKIEEAVAEDERKREEFKGHGVEVRDSAMMLRIKEVAERQQQQEALSPLIEEKPIHATPEKGKKRASTLSPQKTPDTAAKSTPKRKSKLVLDATPAPPSPSVPELPQYEPPKQFSGYDLGDVVLLKKTKCSTAFTADGVQLRTARLSQGVESDQFSSELCMQHYGHTFNVSQIWQTKEPEVTDSQEPIVNGGDSFRVAQPTANKTQEVPVILEPEKPAGIPKPPPMIRQAQMTVHFNNSLRLSFSYYGPKGNGEIPHLPCRPAILDVQPTVETSRPPSQTAQKLSKKQLEQQQQLLEQQRLEQEKLVADQRLAKAKYEQECTNLSRNYKYQQLFISTECGLNVCCHPMVNFEAEPNTVDGTDAFIVIKQWHSYSSSTSHLCQDIAKEKFRYYHAGGYMVKFMSDKSFQVFGARGYRYRPALAKEIEMLQEENASSKDLSDTQANVDQSARVMTSANGLTFADNQQDSTVTDKMVWVVTTPLGESYIWKSAETCENEGKPESETLEPGEADDAEKQDILKPVVMKLGQLHIVRATDPVTNEVYNTREDNVVLVQHPNGSCTTQFEDGTRFTVSLSKEQPSSDLTMECEGFATVHFKTSASTCQLTFPDQSTVSCFTNGSYEVKKNHSYNFTIENNGKAEYEIPNSTYLFDHTKEEGLLCCKDCNNNKFSVDHHGNIEAEAPNPIHHVAFQPRYFILKKDKTAYELHRNNQVEDFVANASTHDSTVVITDPLPNQPDATTTTVIESIHQRRVHPISVPMKEDNIVPYNLRCGNISVHESDSDKPKKKFGSLAGRGLSIGSQENQNPRSQFNMPLALRYRQFIQFSPFTRNKIDKVYDVLAAYIEQMKTRAQRSAEIQPTDDRSTPEKQLSYTLQSLFPDFLPLTDIKRSYQTGWEEKFRGSVKPVAPPITEKGINFIEQSKVEKAEAEKMRASLKARDISPYFSSEQYKMRSPVQSPDMKYFASKLARPKVDTAVSPSTLKSSMESLALDGSSSTLQLMTKDKVDNSSQDDTTDYAKDQIESSTSQTTDGRPGNPTPKVASARHEEYNSDFTSLEEESKTTISIKDQNLEPSMNLTHSQRRIEPNTKYAMVEAPVRRKVKTSSIKSGASKLRGFKVSPMEINFGVLREGSSYKFKLKLTNIGVDSEHFKVRQPPPSTGIKIVYIPGAVAAGLTRKLSVEVFAMAVGATGDQSCGQVSHDLEIVTESEVIHIPITADVLTRKFYDINSSLCRQSHGVELMDRSSNRPRPLKV